MTRKLSSNGIWTGGTNKNMEKIDIDDLISWTDSAPVILRTKSVIDFSTDSRTVKKNDFFIALKGPNFDGHKFIGEAVDKGISGFAFEKNNEHISDVIKKVRENNLEISIIECRNSLSFLMDAARGYMSRYSPVSIGITGSVGKTTTKNFIASIFKKCGKTVYSKKSFNNEIGIPKTIFETDSDTEYFIAEIGMRAKGQIGELSSICNIKYGIITRIGPSHLEFFENVEEIAKSKIEISRVINKNKGMLLLNADDEYYHVLKKYSECKTISCGHGPGYKYNFSNISADENACYEFDLNLFKKKIIRLRSPIPGFHNIYNVMLAAAISYEIGIDIKIIKESIKETVPDDLRMEIVEINGKYVINDCYNANPVSFKSSIDTLKLISETKKSRSVAIVGDMFELGNKSDKFHEGLGEYLSANGINILIALGGKAKKTYSVFSDNKNNYNECYYFPDKDSLIKSLKDIIKKGDIVLIKGSRGNLMEDIINYI